MVNDQKLNELFHADKMKRIRMFLCILLTGIATSFLYYAVSTALPSMMKELEIKKIKGQWLNSAYSAAMGISIFANIYLSKRFRAKTISLCAMGIMLGGTFLCYVSRNFSTLVLGRIVQAIGNGLTISLGQQLLYEMYEKEMRGRVIGWYSFVICLSQALSPLFAGYVTERVGWRVLFFIGILFLGVDFILAVFFLKNIWEVQKHPTVSFHGIRHASFFVGVFGSCVLFVLLMAGTMGLPVYLQTAFNQSPSGSGLILLPGALLLALVNPMAGKIYDNHGKGRLFAGGSAILLVGVLGTVATILWGDWYLKAEGLVWAIGIFSLFRGIGTGLLMTPLITYGLKDTEPSASSEANGIFVGARTVFGAIGAGIASILAPNR